MQRSCGISLPFWLVRAESVVESADDPPVYHTQYEEDSHAAVKWYSQWTQYLPPDLGQNSYYFYYAGNNAAVNQ
jgi:hypothetical protein